MQSYLVLLSLIAANPASEPIPTAAPAWGHLRGRFVYDGAPPEPRMMQSSKGGVHVEVPDESIVVDKDGGIANIFVYLSTNDAPVHPDYDKNVPKDVILRVVDKRFVPHTLLLRRGRQQLRLDLKQDEEAHNAFPELYYPEPRGSVLVRAATEPIIDAKAPLQSRPCRISCNIHAWERSYFLIHDSPYMTISKSDGSFELRNLPVGMELVFVVWHEIRGPVQLSGGDRGRFRATISADETLDLGTIKLAPDVFTRKGD
jgi:hypothetical protein